MKDDIKPLISIVVLLGPAKRKEIYQTIDSIYQSEYKNFEIILVDNTGDLNYHKKIQNKYQNIKIIILPENTGMFGYNIGFANAQGEIILALDDDCTVYKDTLNKIVYCLKSIDEKVAIISTNVYNPYGKYYYYQKYLKNNTTEIYTFAGGAVIFKRKIFEKAGYYDKDFFCWLHEDDLAIRVLNEGYKIYFSKDIIINHLDRSDKLKKITLIYTFRNKAWFNLKHFYFMYFPALVIRDIAWITLTHIKKGDFKSILYGFQGYIKGYLTLGIPLKKRRMITRAVQKEYLHSYLYSK